jgi:hypothetical protein
MINKKLIRIFFFLNNVFFVLSCQAQPDKKPYAPIIGETPLILESVDFNLNILQFYSNKNVFNGSTGFVIEKKTVYGDEYEGEPKKKPVIRYDQIATFSKDTLALFGKQPFCTLNTATTLDNKLMIISAKTAKINQQESNNIINVLTKKYGQYHRDSGQFVRKFEVYLWKLKDRIIQYTPLPYDPNSILYISVGEEPKTNQQKETGLYYEGCLFILKNEFVNEVMDKISSRGTYVYLHLNKNQ